MRKREVRSTRTLPSSDGGALFKSLSSSSLTISPPIKRGGLNMPPPSRLLPCQLHALLLQQMARAKPHHLAPAARVRWSDGPMVRWSDDIRASGADVSQIV